MEVRFVILQPDDPGEILLATTLIRCLKTQLEDTGIYSIVHKRHQWLLESNPHLEEVFVYQESNKELLDAIRDLLPDYVIDLHGGREFRRFKNRLKVLDFTIREKPVTDTWLSRAFETCKLFDVQDDGAGPGLDTGIVYRNILPGSFLDGYIVLSLDSKLPRRPLTDDQITRLAVMTEKPIVITGNTQDRKLADHISQSSGCAVFPACGDLSMPEIASLLDHARGAIFFDSEWNSIGAAMGVKMVTILENQDINELKNLAMWARSLFQSHHDRITV